MWRILRRVEETQFIKNASFDLKRMVTSDCKFYFPSIHIRISQIVLRSQKKKFVESELLQSVILPLIDLIMEYSYIPAKQAHPNHVRTNRRIKLQAFELLIGS
jgi:hypothetical protein